MKPCKFKVGDRVVGNEHMTGTRYKEEGVVNSITATIEGLTDKEWLIYVKWKDGYTSGHYQYRLSLLNKKYMCYVEGKAGPTKMHDSLDSAKKEAERLGAKENRPVYVLEAVAKVIVPPPVRVEPQWSDL